MTLEPLWSALLACLAASLWATLTVTGRKALAWLLQPVLRPLRAWRDRRAADRTLLGDMARSWQAHEARFEQYVQRVDQHVAESNAAKLRTTEQFEAIVSETRQIREHLNRQDAAAEEIKTVLADSFSMTQVQFEASPVAHFVCDSSGNNLQVNAALVALTGVERAELMGRRWQRVVHPDDLGPHLRRFRQAQNGHYVFDDLITYTPPGRPPLRVRVHMLPHPRNTPPASRWAGTVTPVSMEQTA